ncbi:MAG: DMT family transporter, partial [Clostridiales bacterium]
MFICEKSTFTTIIAAAIPLLYAGVLSCGIAYTLQILGQKHSDPSVASLLLSLESVVAVLAGWILLDQTISLREFGGCVLVFAAILLAQLPDSLRIKKHHIRAFPEI